MSLVIPVSFKNSERELFHWFMEHGRKQFSFSEMAKGRLGEKKEEWEIAQSNSPESLMKRVAGLKKTISQMSSFLDLDEEIKKKWYEFNQNSKPREVVEPKTESIIKQGKKEQKNY